LPLREKKSGGRLGPSFWPPLKGAFPKSSGGGGGVELASAKYKWGVGVLKLCFFSCRMRQPCRKGDLR
jgi:hypothetical protein